MTSLNQPYRALLLDLSGVLYEGSHIIEGAIETVARARERKLILRFVTNTATKSSATIARDLKKLQIDVQPGELFTAPKAAKSYILQERLRPYCLLHRDIKSEFEQIDQHDPNCVVLGDARDDLSYAALNQAFRLCKQGAPLLGIGMNKYFKDDEGLKLDAGAFIKAISWAADCEPIIMGKPSQDFFEQVVHSTGCKSDECLMVGDDVISDVQGAIDAGLQACLVKTGKFQQDDLDKLPETAQVINSIADLL